MKEKGNACVKKGDYAEAVMHYTAAIQTDPCNAVLHSNRSLAFLKMQQYHLAYQDAKKTVELKPDWVKGYFRKAEVEFATFHFDKALTSYTNAFCLQKDDHSLMDAMKKTHREFKKDARADQQIPWLGAAVGIVIGVIIVFADFMVAEKSVLTNPLLKMLLTIAIALLGYGFCRGYRYYIKNQRDAMLEPPPDLLGLGSGDQPDDRDDSSAKVSGQETRDQHKRFSKAQARHRFKKGKTN